VASALDYAHRHQIVHRDIKPENVMLHDGEAMVTDFGIAKAVTAAAGQHLTQTGTAVGTPAYMSPEQAAGSKDLDGRSDLYSLGCVLYEMLAGETPFAGTTPPAMVAREGGTALPGLRASRDEIESEGIRRAREQMQRADRVLLVLDDAAHGALPAEVLQHVPAKLPRSVIRNKIDLTGRAAGVTKKADETEIALSAKTGAGLDDLRRHLKDCMGFQAAGEGTFMARRRHLDAIRRAQACLVQGQARLRESRAGELLAEELRLAQQALSEITGEFTPEDLLGKIFSSFCIGK